MKIKERSYHENPVFQKNTLSPDRVDKELKITNLKELFNDLAKDAAIVMPEYLNIKFTDSLYLDLFNNFTEKFTKSYEDLIDFHNYIIVSYALNLAPLFLAEAYDIENKLFKGYSYLESYNNQEKCLDILLKDETTMLDSLLLLKPKDELLNQVTIIINIELKIETAFAMTYYSVKYPTDCKENASDVYKYKIIRAAFDLLYMAYTINNQNVNSSEVNIESSNVEPIIQHYCKNDTFIPGNIEAKNILEVLATSKMVANKYNCEPSSMDLDNC
ncbi:unnamed protein product [Gordionus sp. m RMFG-2023]